MKKRIFHSIAVATTLVVMISMLLILFTLHHAFTLNQQRQLKRYLLLAFQGVEMNDISYLTALPEEGLRLTLIDEDGTVLFDNQADANEMENHLNRPEVEHALLTGYGESSRQSDTLFEKQLYAAKRLSDGRIIRASVSHATIIKTLFSLVNALIVVLLLSLGVAFWLASKLSRRIVAPLNRLNLDKPLENEGYDELSPLLVRIDSQQRTLLAREDQFRRQEKDFSMLVASISEGMILLDHEGNVLFMNPAAQAIISVSGDYLGKSLLSLNRNFDLLSLIHSAQQGKKSSGRIEIGDSFYLVSAVPIDSDQSLRRIAVVLVDQTDSERAQKQRREFTANVSHELKTPLHALAGYSELLKLHMVKEEDLDSFYQNLDDRVHKLISLVEDMISLSNIDEGAYDIARQEVDLYAIVLEAVRELAPFADEKKIDIHVSGESTVIIGLPKLLNSLTFNLIENAIRYNKPSGRVDVSVQKQQETVVLVVKDTGIGIPKDEIEHIFQRFYQVDKGRSSGGTGLGLALVKHAAQIHQAGVDVDSSLGEGTTMTVRFPCLQSQE